MARKRQKTLSHGYSKRLLYVRPETKNRDTDITQTYNTNQTATFPLTDIGAGSGASGRVGAKIRLSTLDVHCQTKNTTDGDFGRFILYVPKSITDRIAVSVNGAVNRDLYWVLWDKVFNLPQINVEPSHFHYTYRFPMSMITEYFGSGATDITKNGVYLYHVTDATTGQMDGFHRVWFQDN